jgi:type I restriction enzyme S subunit
MEAIGEDGSLNLERVRPVAEVRNGYSYFENGDVAFAKVTPCFENGKGALMRDLQLGAGFGTSELTVLRPKGNTSARFLNFVVQSEQFRQNGAGAMTGAGGLKRVPDDFTRDFKTPWPPRSEQERIATFLDKQTARIDSLIAEKERLATSVRAYEQAEISRLLTYGVNEAPLKKTGKSFIPEAPTGWRVTAFKRALIAMGQGWSPQCESQPAQPGQWGVLKVGCVNGTRFDASENKALPTELQPDLTCVIRKGDVLMSRANTKELVGMAAIVEDDYPHLMLCDKLYRLELKRDWVLPDYAVLALRSDLSRRQLELGASGASSSMQNISQDVVRELLLAFPSLEEQQAIVERAAQIRDACGTLAEHIREHLGRLREYRSSLISAAVTGQLNLNSDSSTRAN